MVNLFPKTRKTSHENGRVQYRYYQQSCCNVHHFCFVCAARISLVLPDYTPIYDWVLDYTPHFVGRLQQQATHDLQ